MPGGPLAAFMVVPMALLAGICFLQNRGWRSCCNIGLILWIGIFTILQITHREWARLLFPVLVIAAWVFLSEVKREFKD
jgi:hypothetical protein